jgi:RNA polymerase sigma-70 factor, ECF subfamily
LDFSDAELIGQCLQGDNGAFDVLVGRYQRQVYNFCYGMLGNADDASDASQDAFVKTYYALEKFRRDAQFLTWVLRIASNVCIDLYRRRSRHQTASLDDDDQSKSIGEIPSRDPAPDDLMQRCEGDRLILDAVARLPERHRSAVVMFHFSGMSIKDISRALGRPEGTVKSDLHIAREMLRRKLEGVVVEV